MNVKNIEADYLFDDENFKIEILDGFVYSFENENCYECFKRLGLEFWPKISKSRLANTMRKQGWRFFICESIDDEHEAAGMTFYKTKTIVISLTVPVVNSFFHEIGHVFQAYAKSISRPIVCLAVAKEGTAFCKSLRDYYLRLANEPDRKLSNFILSQMPYFLDTNEYMAESIALLIYDFEPFKKRCPLTCEIAQNILDYIDGGKERLSEMEIKYGLVE